MGVEELFDMAMTKEVDAAAVAKAAVREMYAKALEKVPMIVAGLKRYTLSREEWSRIDSEIKDCWEMLAEFSKGAVATQFGEVLATLPLSFLKAVNASKLALQILNVLDKMSTVLDLTKLGAEGAQKVQKLIEKEIRSLPPEAQLVLSVALTPSGVREIHRRIGQYGREDFDRRLKEYDALVPGLSLWTDTINRVVYGGSPTKMYRDKYLVEVVDLENKLEIAKQYRGVVANLEKGAQLLRQRSKGR